MANTNYPASIDTPVNPTPTSVTTSPSHSAQHGFENDAIVALETKVGINSSAVTTTHDYKLSNITGIDKATSLSLIPDSSVGTKGLTKMSVAPVAPTNPIAVGDNDPRIPTSGQGSALVGTSGTPSTSNKYVTDADTSATSSANKVVRYDSIGNIATSNLVNSMLAGETITAGQSIYSGYNVATPIAYDNKLVVFSTVSSTLPNSVTQAFTVGNNSNRYLVVQVNLRNGNGSNANPVTASVSYAGVAMTLLQSSASPVNTYLYGIAAPTVGNNNITFTITNNGTTPISYGYDITVFSFYNCSLSGSYMGSTYSAPTASLSTTIANPGGIILGIGFGSSGSGMGGSWTTSAELTNQFTSNADLGTIAMFSGYQSAVDISGTDIITATSTGSISFQKFFAVNFSPSTAAFGGYAKLSTANSALAGGSDRYTKFVGIALIGGTFGQTISVVNSGLVSGLSGFSIGDIYYLSNTFGAINNSQGTVSKKIGIALSATTLLLKDSI